MPAGGWGGGGGGSLAGAWGAPSGIGSFGGANNGAGSMISGLLKNVTGQGGGGKAMGGPAGMRPPMPGGGMGGPNAIGQALLQARKGSGRGPGMAEGGLPPAPASQGAAGAQGYPGSPSGPGLPGGGTDPYLSKAPMFRKMGAPETMPEHGKPGAQMGAALAAHLPDEVLVGEMMRRMSGRNPFEIERQMRAGHPPHGTDMPTHEGAHVPQGPYHYEEGFLDPAIDRAVEEPMETADDIVEGLMGAKMGTHMPKVMRQAPTIDRETADSIRGASDKSDAFDRGNESDKRAREAAERQKKDEERTEWARKTRQIPMSEKRGGKVRYTTVKEHRRRIGGKVKEALATAKRGRG